MKVLILSGPNHGFDKCTAVIETFLKRAADLDVRLEEYKEILVSAQTRASLELARKPSQRGQPSECLTCRRP